MALKTFPTPLTTKMDDINNFFHMYLINNLEYPINHENVKHIPY